MIDINADDLKFSCFSLTSWIYSEKNKMFDYSYLLQKYLKFINIRTRYYAHNEESKVKPYGDAFESLTYEGCSKSSRPNQEGKRILRRNAV